MKSTVAKVIAAPFVLLLDADLQTDELRIPDQQQLRELAPTVVDGIGRRCTR